ncbi:unnamed protein product [Symbiodinium natans]|uniref:Uncharacterized protein n=1 Tax=Symbiodinium natans TaxID=878477 RepID=A0A812TVZ2_9DINO|nr:unnamed protein product [Symbiodinium natans]
MPASCAIPHVARRVQAPEQRHQLYRPHQVSACRGLKANSAEEAKGPPQGRMPWGGPPVKAKMQAESTHPGHSLAQNHPLNGFMPKLVKKSWTKTGTKAIS